MWEYRARITEAHDGDTLKVVLDVGFENWKVTTLRLLNCYAPELKQRGGPETGAYLRDLIAAVNAKAGPDAWPWMVRTHRLVGDSREVTTWGRYVANVWDPAHPADTLSSLVNAYVSEHDYPRGKGSGEVVA